jgi:hypothetical protein
MFYLNIFFYFENKNIKINKKFIIFKIIKFLFNFIKKIKIK